MSYDAITVGRFTALAFFGFIAFAFIFISVKTLVLPQYRTIFIVVVFFILWSFISFVQSNINIDEKLYGVTGRQFGLITQICLVSLMLLGVLTCSSLLMDNLLQVLVFGGFISGVYGIIQFLGLDPIAWINPYSPVFGIFGNPNFHSAYLGIASSAAFALLFFEKSSGKKIFYYLSNISLSLVNIKLSESIQGFLVLFTGFSVVIFFLLLHKQRVSGNLSFFKLYLCFIVISVLAIVSDVLQKSPWSPILYQESISFRGDFWRTGARMTWNNSFFGVGPDGYRDYYRSYRDRTTASRTDSNVPTDSAHNGLLDLSSSGGLPLLMIYLIFVAFTFLSVYKLTKRLSQNNFIFIPVFSAWIAYLSQSMISTGHLALSFWGWILPGLLIGFEIKTREKSLPDMKALSEFKAPLAIFLGGTIGLGIGLPILIADASFQSSAKSGIVSKIEASAEMWPRSTERINIVSELLRLGNLPENSIVNARKAVEFNSLNFESWQELSNQPKATDEERQKALEMMKKLDPFNPILK